MMSMDDFSTVLDILEEAGGGSIFLTEEESLLEKQAGRIGVDGG
jgi:hypothetical protein